MAGLREVGKSAVSTVNLMVAGAAAVTAAALGSIPIALLGGAAYAALVAWDVLGRAQEPRSALPDLDTLQNPEARQAVNALVAARRELKRVVEQSPQQIGRYLDMALTSIVELESHAGKLIGRLDELSRYLGTTDSKTIRHELLDSREKAAQTTDAEAREQFTHAAESRQAQLQIIDDLVAARDRALGHLSRIVATYEALPSRVVRMRTLDAQAADALGGDVGQEVDRMNHEIAAFEETLQSLAAKVAA
jgi:chromosome segregation ATPase